MENEFIENNKGKKIGIIILIILLIFLIFGLGFYLFFLRPNPKNYLDYISDEITSYSNSFYEKFKDIKTSKSDKTLNEKGVLEFKTESEDLKFLNNYKMDVDLKAKNKDMILNLNLLEKNEDFLTSSMYLTDNSLYLELKDLYDKTIKLGTLEKEDEIEGISIIDLYKNLSPLIECYKEALKESKVKSQNLGFTKIKFTYEITDSNQEKVVKKFKQLYEKNENLKENIEIEDFNNLFTPAKIEVIINRFNKEIYSFTKTSDNDTLKISKDEDIDKYNIKYNESEGTLEIIDNQITYEEIKDEKIVSSITFKLLVDGVELNYNQGKVNFNFSIREVENEDLRVALKIQNSEDKIDLDVDGDIKTSSDTKKTNFLANLKIDEENIQINYNGNTTLNSEEIEMPTFTNVKEANELTENDYNTIVQKLVGKLLTSDFIGSITGFSSEV